MESGEVVVLSQLHEAEQEAEAARLKTAGGWVAASTPGGTSWRSLPNLAHRLTHSHTAM